MTYQAWFAKALVTMTIAILVSGGLFAGTAAACGFPGQFGGCLAHGNFDPSGVTNSADFGWDAQAGSTASTRTHRLNLTPRRRAR
jgi:hypothetical protein